MAGLTEYELEREANIARNRALLAQLEIKEAVKGLGIPPPKPKAKPIQPTKRVKRENAGPSVPRRQSARLRKSLVDLNESPTQKRKREEEERLKEEEEKLERDAKEQMAKKPRHQDLGIVALLEGEAEESSTLSAALKEIAPAHKRISDPDAFTYDGDADKAEKRALEELRNKMQNLKVVARAKVTQSRIYSAAYHPEASKDLIFFGDKHGQLGIWDARAPPDDVSEEDGENSTPQTEREGGKYWRLQVHWPATARSSISCIKFDPINSHTVFTSAYDCTIRSLCFTSDVSKEVFSTDGRLINSIDLAGTGHEMWISDAEGGLTHLDLREDKSKACRYELSTHKIGTVSINPTAPWFLLTSSNNRLLKMWDTRKLLAMTGVKNSSSHEFDAEAVQTFLASKVGIGALQGEHQHGQSATSAYWDPRGRGIVSTSYDDKLRLWDIGPSMFKQNSLSSFKPICQISHNCQTGKWVTLLRAQWSSNPDFLPHFTIGNMRHSLDIFSCKGDLVARLEDPTRISAVQAVTCSHPSVLERAVSGNGSGRCVLWAPPE